MNASMNPSADPPVRQTADPPAKIPATVKQLGAVSLLNDFSSEMMYPLLPAFISGLGGGAVAIGLLDGLADAVASLLKYPAGRLADRPRWRVPLVVGGYAIAALARPVIGFADRVWQVIALRGLDRAGKGMRSPGRDAIIADVTPVPIRGRAFGLHRSLDHLGAVFGPVTAWILLTRFDTGVPRVITYSLVPGFLAVAVVAVALGGRPAAGGKEPRGESTRGSLQVAAHPRREPWFFLVVAFALVRLPDALLIFRAEDLGIQVGFIPLVWAVVHVARSSVSYPSGWLTDRFGVRISIMLGWLVHVAAMTGFAFAGTLGEALFWFVMAGLVTALTEAPERKLVAALGGRGKRGRKFGAYHASVGIAALPGGLGLGLVYQAAGGRVALLLSGLLGALLIAVAAAVPLNLKDAVTLNGSE